MKELLCPEVTGYKSVEEFLFKYFSQNCPATFSTTEEGSLEEQCPGGKSRSVGDLYWLVKSAFEEVTFEEFIKMLNKVLVEKFHNRLLLKCDTVQDITCYKFMSPVVQFRYNNTSIQSITFKQANNHFVNNNEEIYTHEFCNYSISSIYKILTND